MFSQVSVRPQRGCVSLVPGPFSVADRRGRPLRPKNFSISCSFSENLAKSCRRPLIRGILDPSLFLGVVDTLCPGGRYVTV